MAFAIAECCWIINGDDTLAYLDPWNSKYREFVGDAPHVYGGYGQRLRRAFGCDQLIDAAIALRENPESRQIVLQIYHPGQDLPSETGQVRSKDIPCNVTSLLKVRNQKLEWTQVLRSNDLCKGVPYNFVQFTTLQEFVAGIAGVDVGSYTHFSDSLHIYESDEEGECYGVEVTTASENSEDLRLPLDEGLGRWQELHAIIGRLGQTTKAEEVLQVIKGTSLGAGFSSLALICGAERLRRLRRDEPASEMTARVQNPLLREMQRRWHQDRNRRSEHARS